MSAAVIGIFRGVGLGEDQRADGIDNNLDVDLAGPLERPPLERVLVEPLTRGVSFDMTHSKLTGIPLQEPDLLAAERDGLVLRVRLKAQQALIAGREFVP